MYIQLLKEWYHRSKTSKIINLTSAIFNSEIFYYFATVKSLLCVLTEKRTFMKQFDCLYQFLNNKLNISLILTEHANYITSFPEEKVQ